MMHDARLKSQLVPLPILYLVCLIKMATSIHTAHWQALLEACGLFVAQFEAAAGPPTMPAAVKNFARAMIGFITSAKQILLLPGHCRRNQTYTMVFTLITHHMI
jgi:hypothetical protein